MPCYDSRGDSRFEVIYRDKKETLDKVEMLEAALCAAMTAHEKLMVDLTTSGVIKDGDLYAIFDFEEAGITENQLKNWWSNHKMEDEYRKIRKADAEKKRLEAVEKKRVKEELRKAALSKLSKEERAILGIKS